MSARQPIELPHPSEYVQDEMDARGWDRDRLALEMVGGDTDRYGVARLSLDFFFVVGPTDTNLRIGEETDAQLALAFGVSNGSFLRLEEAWLKSLGVDPDPPSSSLPHQEKKR